MRWWVEVQETRIPVQQDQANQRKSSRCTPQIYFRIEGVQACWGLLSGILAAIGISCVFGSKPLAHYSKQPE